MLKKIIPAKELSEKEIIEGCLKGDIRCEEHLYTTHAAKMFTVCLRYAPDYHTAEDILQEGFVKIFKNLHQFRFEGSLEGWIRRIMVNTALKYIQSKIRIVSLDDASLSNEAVETDNTIISKLSSKELLRLIQHMPEGYRAVFNLYVFEQFSHKEITAALEITEGTSKSQLSKARKFLQDKIALMNDYKIAVNV